MPPRKRPATMDIQVVDDEETQVPVQHIDKKQLIRNEKTEKAKHNSGKDSKPPATVPPRPPPKRDKAVLKLMPPKGEWGPNDDGAEWFVDEPQPGAPSTALVTVSRRSSNPTPAPASAASAASAAAAASPASTGYTAKEDADDLATAMKHSSVQQLIAKINECNTVPEVLERGDEIRRNFSSTTTGDSRKEVKAALLAELDKLLAARLEMVKERRRRELEQLTDAMAADMSEFQESTARHVFMAKERDILLLELKATGVNDESWATRIKTHSMNWGLNTQAWADRYTKLYSKPKADAVSNYVAPQRRQLHPNEPTFTVNFVLFFRG